MTDTEFRRRVMSLWKAGVNFDLPHAASAHGLGAAGSRASPASVSSRRRAL